ncbi:MAG: DUF5320 domain-containing protein [Dehalococcoidales bacterium]|jgi:hypothetical protein
MPNFDNTGPKGNGPMTGQGKGRCAISLNTPEQELGFLKNQEKALMQQLKDIKSRIGRLENHTQIKEAA